MRRNPASCEAARQRHALSKAKSLIPAAAGDNWPPLIIKCNQCISVQL